MTPIREAVVLPALLLTVVLLGGFRAGDSVRLVPPTLTALVLAVLLIGTLIRTRALVPQVLLHGCRSGQENMSGAVVLLTLFAASAQVLNLLIPDHGLLHAAFAVFVFCQLMTIGAARMDRAGMLRALAVLFGSLFVLRFIVVEALYASNGGLLQRVLTTLMSGASLGSIVYEPNAPATGYVAFVTLTLYLVALALLPRERSTALIHQPAPSSSALRPTVTVLLVLCLAAAGGCRKSEPPAEADAAKPPAQTPAAPPARAPNPELVSAAQRAAALRSAQVWHPPPVPIAQADLRSNPPGPGAFDEKDQIECRLVVKPMGGTTPKFDCELPGKDVIRVKYGRGNPELQAEIAATRLLSALGFGADRMYVVEKVRCAACSSFPFQSLNCLADTKLERACFPRGLDYSRSTDFEYVTVERRLEGRRLESSPDEGWAWFELDRVEAKAGGAPAAQVDALRLFALFIAHWDNKAANQRLVCLPGGDLPDGGCSRPMAILQDVGASFGPTKLDLHNWRSTPIWANARTCAVSMEQLPWGGGTFPERQISEEGRQFLLALLQQLSTAQLQDLFTGARVESSEGVIAEGRQPSAWAAAFADKVRQIRDAGPCPPRAAAAP